MYAKEKEDLKMISAYAGARSEYVQGGGGNVSVKFDGRLMAIKASGYTLAEITAEKGYVTVDYGKIMDYYNTVDPNAGKDYEKESLEVGLNSIELLKGMEERRPSVEVGFHSFLSRCVIHTHSVYANLLCCSEEGRDIAKKIFADSSIAYLFIPYIDPGFRLTLEIRQALLDFESRCGRIPDAIFLDNHGIIVHHANAYWTVFLHEEINRKITEYFDLTDYPKPKIRPHAYKSDTPYLIDFIAQNKAYEDYFNNIRLYPDQLVYLGGKMGKEIRFYSNELLYFAGEKEAQAMDETILGVAYVIGAIKKAGLTLRQMDEKGASFINNWESEKYRKTIIEK